MPQTYSTFAFGGGLDTNSAALAVPPGRLIAALNYEPLAEGYGRVQGHERFDGRQAPSATGFTALDFDAGSAPIFIGDEIEGATSGAAARVAMIPQQFSGSWDAGTAAATLILIDVTGTFQDNETIEVGGSPKATVNGSAEADLAPTTALQRAWRLGAQKYRREEIQPVPGSGPVRGVAVHRGTVYAWRDNAPATEARCYRATASGWQILDRLRRMSFNQGSTEIFEGDTITGAASGSAGTVVSIITASGSWSDGDAAGTIDFVRTSGAGFTLPETIKVGTATCAKTSSAPANITLAPGGRYRTIGHNFYGAADRYRLYGTNEVGPAFELNDYGIITILTGMDDDRPQRIFEIGNHLGLIFTGGSVQVSGTGEPRIFSVLLGAGEIGFGTEVTDVIQANETAVALFGREKIATLTGHDVNDFTIDVLTEEAGAKPDTAQRIGRTVYIDNRGLRDLTATQAFGNFKAGALSGIFEQYLRAKVAAGAQPIGSWVCRAKSQYRLFYDDGTGFAVYMGGKTPEMIPFDFGGTFTPYCFGAGEMADGTEGMFAGGEDGFVYRLDSGTNFDGEAVTAFAVLPFNHFGAPWQDDRFHKIALEMQAPIVANVRVAVSFDYGNGYEPVFAASTLTGGGSGLLDVAQWNNFVWSAPAEGLAECYIDGIGRNASFAFSTIADLDEGPHVLQAYTVHRSPRKQRR